MRRMVASTASLVIYLSLWSLLQTKVLSYQYKVGDLDSWGIPTSANPKVYEYWSKYHKLSIGDSLLFLYPPSQDSVIQVTKESYEKCNVKNPILYMNDGNSLFNITSNGEYYFTSGEAAHCEKKQKLYINVGGVRSSSSGSDTPSFGPTANAPSYPTVFGSIPVSPSASISASSNSASSVSPSSVLPLLLLLSLLGFALYP